MMNRALRWISQEVQGLHTAFYVLAASALLSSILALLRDRILAHVFGAGATLDLYYAAFRIPDLIFVGTGALVSVYILIPELIRRSETEQRDYIDTIITGFLAFSIVLASLAAVFAPLVLQALFPQFVAQGHMPELVMLTRIILMQPILLGLSNILASVTQTRRRYWLYSISPLLYNLGIIFGTVALYPIFGIQGLAWGVVVGALLHFGIQLPSVASDGFFRRLPRIREPRALYTTAVVSIPRALALSMNQITFMGLIALAGMLAPGSIAVFMFAYNLQAVPLSIVGSSYSVATFPTLARALSRGEREGFIDHIALSARYIFLWSLPITALVIVLRAYIVRFVLGSGAFDWTDTRLTAAGLAIFSLSLAAQGLTLLIVRGYYAAGRTFVPFIVALLSAGVTITIGVFSIGMFQSTTISNFTQDLLRVAGVPGSNVLSLAFAYSFVAILAAIVLLVHFERRFSGFWKLVRGSWAQSAVAAIAGGAAAYFVLEVVGPITLSSTTLSIFMKGFASGTAGIIVSALALYALGSREYAETVVGIRARLWRGRGILGSTVVASAEEGSPSTPQ